MSSKKACFLDWDSTTADEREFSDKKAGLPSEMEKALVKLQEKDYIVTFNTTRDPIEMMDVLGEKWNKIFSQDTLIGLENGGRVGKFVQEKDGITFVDTKTFPLSNEEIDLVTEVLNKDKSLSLKFYSGDYKRGQLVWTQDKSLTKELDEKFVLNSEILHCDIEDLNKLLKECKPCYVTIYGDVELPKELNFFKAKDIEFNINHKDIDKRSSLEFMSKELDIDLSKSIIAGDSSPDKPMLDIDEVRRRILVRKEDLVENDERTHYVKNARELGKFLYTIIEDF